MAQLPVLEYPDPRLQQKSEIVTEFGTSVETLVTDLLDTLYATSGIGLSAPQINDRRRVLVLDLSDDGSAPEVFVNPEILKSAKLGIVEESCLSVPGVVSNIVRSTRVLVRTQNQFGETTERNLEGMHAVCLQHEIDHLDGLLLIDRLSFIRKLGVRSKLKRLRAASESQDAA